MDTVIIVVHLMVIVALIAVVLLQRSEGGALGIGGSNAFLTSRGQGNVLTKATAILGLAFFLTSVGLTVLSRVSSTPGSVLDTVQSKAAAPAGGAAAPASSDTTSPAPAATDTGTILDRLNRDLQKSGAAPAGDTTTVPAPADAGAAPAPADNTAAPAGNAPAPATP